MSTVILTSVSSVRARARAANRISDLTQIRTALEMYYQQNGAYPTSSGWNGIYSCWGYQSTSSNPDGWISGLAPTYIPKLPREPRNHTACDAQYIYSSNSVDYKLIVHNPENCEAEISTSKNLKDPVRDGGGSGALQDGNGCWAYGYWTPGAVEW